MASMAETRSKALIKEVAAHEVEETYIARLEALEESMTVHNAELKKDIANMFEDIRLMSNKETATTSAKVNRGKSPAVYVTPVIHLNSPQMTRGVRSCMNINYSGLMRLSKLDFLRFSGDKVKEWLFKLEQFFVIDNTPEELKVGITSIHFDDLASTWHQSVVESDIGRDVIHDWQAYKLMLHERFDEILEVPIAELNNWKKQWHC